MSTDLPPFPRVEGGLRAIIQAAFPAVAGPRQVGTGSFPADLVGLAPYVHIVRVGGPRTQLVDEPQVSIDVFAEDWQTTADLAERISAFLLGFRGIAAGVRLDDAEEIMAPVLLPWEEADVVRFGSTIRFSVRR